MTAISSYLPSMFLTLLRKHALPYQPGQEPLRLPRLFKIRRVQNVANGTKIKRDQPEIKLVSFHMVSHVVTVGAH